MPLICHLCYITLAKAALGKADQIKMCSFDALAKDKKMVNLPPASRSSTPASQSAAPAEQTAGEARLAPAATKTTPGNCFGKSVIHLSPAEQTDAGYHRKSQRRVADAGTTPAAHGPTLKQSDDPILEQSLESLGEHPGILYGGSLASSAAQDWVRSNLGSLKDAGVKTLFVQIKKENQPWISDFLNGKLDDNEFRRRMKGATLDPVGMANLLVEARRLSINVVAMDVEDPAPVVAGFGAYVIGDKKVRVQAKWDRLEFSNEAWARAVRQTKRPPNTKYIMIAGDAHTNKMKDSSLRGVDSILNIPSIDIYRPSDILERNHTIPDSAILQNRNMIVPGTVEKSDFIAIVPDPVGKSSSGLK